jgi:hypothetical protein
MSTTNSQTIRMLKSSSRSQTKAVARELHPLWISGSWEDMVAVASLAFVAGTIAFLLIAG